MATTRIKVTDDRQGRSFRTGVNGRFYDLPVDQEVEVDSGLIDHLKGLGVAFDEVEGRSGRASSSKEGSGEGLAPRGPHDVRAPGTDAKTVGDRQFAGDQPGDVTESGGVAYTYASGATIEDDARISDIRVAAERNTAERAPAAEKAGEGESGAKKTAATQDVKPSHKATAEERKAAKPRAKRSSKTAQASKDKASKLNESQPNPAPAEQA